MGTPWSVKRIVESGNWFGTGEHHVVLERLGCYDSDDLGWKNAEKISELEPGSHIRIYFIDSIENTWQEILHVFGDSLRNDPSCIASLDNFLGDYNDDTHDMGEAIVQSLLRLSNLFFYGGQEDRSTVICGLICALIDIATKRAASQFFIVEKFYKEGAEDTWNVKLLGLWGENPPLVSERKLS